LSTRPLAAFTLYPHVGRLLLRSLHVPSNSLNMTTSFIVITLIKEDRHQRPQQPLHRHLLGKP